MVIGGIIALVVAAVGYFYAHSQQKSLSEMTLGRRSRAMSSVS